MTFLIGQTKYTWYKGGLYAQGGDTLLENIEGNWTFLEECTEESAKLVAEQWERAK